MTIYTSEHSWDASDMLAQNLGELVHSGCMKHGDKPAFSCILPTGHTVSISYSELDHLTDAIAAYLRDDLGLVPGDVVAIQAPNILSYPIVCFGIFKAGLTATNVNPLYTIEETNHQLKDSRAKVWFVVDVFGDKVAESIEGTSVEKVFKLGLLDMFPAMQRILLGAALKYVKKAIPPFKGPLHGTFADAIKSGKRHLAKGLDIKQYWQAIDPGLAAIYQYTGGTTGRSKGAELNHLNVAANISQGYKMNKDSMTPGQDIMMLLLPLYHVYALAVGAMSSLHNGNHVVLVPAPRPLSNLKPVFETFDITILPGVNTLFNGLVLEDWFVANPPKNIRVSFSGAAPLQPATAAEWEKITGAKIYEGYGLTEATCAVSTMPLSLDPRRGTCGKPLPGTEIRLVKEDGTDAAPGEPGELWVRGPQVMQGYLNRPEATAEALLDEGWLKTGDVAEVDEEGWIKIVDRMKDMIIVSGFNVYPTDIEDVLTRHDKVADAAVVGVPCPDQGEKVVAWIVSKEETSQEELNAYCREHLTSYKVPRVFAFIEELPKSPVGKVLRREVRDKAELLFGIKN